MTPSDPDVRPGARCAARGDAGAGRADADLCLTGFAKRGLGVGAVAPDNLSEDNAGVVESFSEAAGGEKGVAIEYYHAVFDHYFVTHISGRDHEARQRHVRGLGAHRRVVQRLLRRAGRSSPCAASSARRSGQELALLHAGRQRMRDGQGEPELAVRRRRCSRCRARSSRAIARRACPFTGCTTTARAARRTTATRRASPPARRCSARGGSRKAAATRRNHVQPGVSNVAGSRPAAQEMVPG